MKHGQKNIRKPKGICWREGEMMPEGVVAVAQQHAETMIHKKERRREICSALIIDKV